uniref:MAK10-like protein n=1 Tax=Tanacetum cinerariifolium TaxID=118510 RepID=A0A6L2N8H9_TANCI|nr:hypothetical protein [Tanacetum cinerariifolium]
MGDMNPIHTLGDYSKPGHEGYRNNIELPKENNVVPLDLSPSGKECACVYFNFPFAIKLATGLNDCKTPQRYPDVPTTSQRISLRNMDSFQRLTTKSPSSWHRLLASIQFFYDRVSFHFKCKIDRATGGKLRNKNDNESWEITENLAIYDHEGWNDSKNFVKLEDEKRAFILETPFLTTAKAVIKFDKVTITLRSGKSQISFHRIPESFCKVEKGIKKYFELIAPTMTVNRLVLEWEEKIKLHQEKEMKFDQWRSKNFKNKCPALAKVEMDDEGEVT